MNDTSIWVLKVTDRGQWHDSVFLFATEKEAKWYAEEQGWTDYDIERHANPLSGRRAV